VKDVIADICFQQSLTRASEFDVIATMNLNGDYLSDAVGGPGRRHWHRPGREHQLRDRSRHLRSDPRHRAEVRRHGQGEPWFGTALGCLDVRAPRLDRRGNDIVRAMEATIADKIVTYDFARLMDGAHEVKCSEFGSAIVDRL